MGCLTSSNSRRDAFNLNNFSEQPRLFGLCETINHLLKMWGVNLLDCSCWHVPEVKINPILSSLSKSVSIEFPLADTGSGVPALLPAPVIMSLKMTPVPDQCLKAPLQQHNTDRFYSYSMWSDLWSGRSFDDRVNQIILTGRVHAKKCQRNVISFTFRFFFDKMLS